MVEAFTMKASSGMIFSRYYDKIAFLEAFTANPTKHVF